MRFGQIVLRMTWKERFVQFYKKRTVFPFWREFEASLTILGTLTLKNAIRPKRAAHNLKRAFCTIFMERALLSRFKENFRPVWRFWELWRSPKRFGQNVLRMTWKERFVQFSWKADCFPVLKRISGQYDDFENFDAPKCDLAKTCSAWPEKSVGTIFMESALFSRFEKNFRPVWRFWELWRSPKRFGQNVLRMTWKERFVQFSWKADCFPVLKRISGQYDDFENFDAPKCDLAKTCSAWPEKSVGTIFMESALFSRFEKNFRLVWRFWEHWRSKMRFGQNKVRRPEKSVLNMFHGKRTFFPFWQEFQASVTNLRTLTRQNAIWQKRAAHDLKRAVCTIFMESALFSRFGKNFRPLWRIWELWRSKMRFSQNVLRMTWKERFVQFFMESALFSCFEENLRPVSRFWELWRSKLRFGKTYSAWPEKSVLYNFHGKRTVFPFWREFQASLTILRTLTLKNAIWPKRAPHDLKRAFCTIFMESALFSRFGREFQASVTILKTLTRKCDLAKTCCAWPEKSVLYNFHGKRTVFPFWREFQATWRFWELWRSKMRFGKTCCAWPEKSVLYNFHGKRTVFPFWREFEASFTILRTLTLKNAIWPKRDAHDLKRAFCTIFMETALFFRFEENLRPVSRFFEIWRSKMDLAKTCCAWPEKSLLYNFHGRRTVFPF